MQFWFACFHLLQFGFARDTNPKLHSFCQVWGASRSRWSAFAEDIPTNWPSDMHLAENGWGFLCRDQGAVTAGHGQVPAHILRLFQTVLHIVFGDFLSGV